MSTNSGPETGGDFIGIDDGFAVVSEPKVIKPQPVQILSSKKFTDGFIAPDYLVEKILQRRFVYSLTGQTGGGKTAVALLMASHIARGIPLGDSYVEKGRVLYLAGENPTDIRMRWIAMADNMDFDVKKIDVYFIAGVFKISEMYDHIKTEVDKLGGAHSIIVDTSAAYFEGKQENDNVEARDHALMLRSLTNLSGGPTVLVPCHPTKGAGNDNLEPRGGGAFLNEMDGNLTCKKNGDIVEIHWWRKFRGPDFQPIGFEIVETTSEKLKDSKGNLITTVMAKPLTELRRVDIEKKAYTDQNTVLMTLLDTPSISMRAICDHNKWLTPNGVFYVSRANRALKKLENTKHVVNQRSGWELTEKGGKEAKKLKEKGSK